MVDPSIFTGVINGYLPEPHASLLNGIIWGINLKDNKELYRQLQIVGLLHMVVLSGTNISMLTAIVASITDRLGRKMSLMLTILIIVIFVAFVRPQAPIVRAAIMSILTLVAIVFGRKSQAIYTLFLSALIIAILWPKWITSISFLLSFGATLGLILFAKHESSKKDTPQNIVTNLWYYAKEEFKISLAAQIFTAPLIFIYFKQISTVSIFANILVSWTVAPLMIFGLIASILGKLHFMLGIVPAYLCYALLSYILMVVDFLSRIPYALIDLN